MSKRIKFFIKHLAFSVLIAGLSTLLVFFVWYPAPLAKAVGVTQLFFLMLIIDVIVGPLFGLLVYKEGKKTLKFDLATVIVLQLCAFFYGLYSMEQGRPAWLVYSGVNFDLVKKSDIEDYQINQAKPQFQHPKLNGPTFVNLDAASYRSNQKSIVDMIELPPSASRYPNYYGDISQATEAIKSNAMPLSLLEKYNDKQKVSTILAQYPQATAWIGMSAPVEAMVVLVNKQTGEVIKIVDLRPWQ